MKNSIRFFVCFSLLALLGLLACGENSELEMKQAQLSMDQAKNLHADDLAPTDFQEAQRIWNEAQSAVKQGKPAQALFLRAKSHFDKTAQIAKSRRETLSRELNDMQLTISSGLDKMKTALEKKQMAPKAQGQVKTMATEIEQANEAIGNLVKQGDYVKAVATAKDVQTKIYNAQLIMTGQKPSK